MTIDTALEEVRDLLITRKHQAGRHDQSTHTPKKYGKGGGAGSAPPGVRSADVMKPAHGRVDEPGYKYSSEEAAKLVMDAIGATGVTVQNNYWQDDDHRVTLHVPVSGNSMSEMTKNVRAAGYKGGGQWKKAAYGGREYKWFRNPKTGHGIAIETPSGTGGGAVYGYRVNGYVKDSYRDAARVRGEEWAQ